VTERRDSRRTDQMQPYYGMRLALTNNDTTTGKPAIWSSWWSY